jgi:hypothetical protein
MITLGKMPGAGDQPPGPRKRREAMTLAICWLDDLGKAEKSARETKRPILLDFYNPQ